MKFYTVRKFFYIFLILLTLFATAFSLGVLFIPLPVENLKPRNSTVVLDENDNILRVFLNEKEQYCLPPALTGEVPVKIEKTVIFFEDQYFYDHPGINPFSIGRAFFQNLKSGKIVSGSSTITMQLA